MSETKFYAILTDKGAALEANALATGTPVKLNKFVIGDGGGSAVTPDPTRTTLVNEVYRGDIKSAEATDNQVTFTLYVPPEVGGYTIREAGILAEDGTLYSLSNSPDILKPTESNGAVISITFKYILAVSSTSTVTVVVYDDYLTPAAADKKYLQISKNLSEIKDKGAEAQESARINIGVNLNDYYNKEYIDNIKPVKSVNNTQPDPDGNVNAGTVRTVNNIEPDVNGNVEVPVVNNFSAGAADTYAIVATSGAVIGEPLFYGSQVVGSNLRFCYLLVDSVSGLVLREVLNHTPAGIWVILGTLHQSTVVEGSVLAYRIV